jgi:hypothetical protein
MSNLSLARIEARQRSERAIAQASQRTGVAFDYLYNQAKVESALNPQARARTSSASGLFQFTNQTWLATLKKHGPAHGLHWAANAIGDQGNGRFAITDPGQRQAILDLRFDPDAASAMAAEFAADNRYYLSSRLGRSVEDVDLYLAHFLGAGGAGKFLENFDQHPDAAAAPLFPAAAAANRSIFYAANGAMRSLEEIRSGFAAKMGAATDARSFTPSSLSVIQNRHAVQFSQGNATASIPMEMRGLEAMPGRLSIDFARAAYARLETMFGGDRS